MVRRARAAGVEVIEGSDDNASPPLSGRFLNGRTPRSEPRLVRPQLKVCNLSFNELSAWRSNTCTIVTDRPVQGSAKWIMPRNGDGKSG
jgi:hypothetical protein